ncbi:MAG: DEAD/DEAH box helicase family protein [Defluviitaleaceae bacterium]|nr:DEAD/DEAH box helicase family protein [Defluviitaleaceae bacterium]
MFLENYNFKYPWRKYQADVLAELETHMHDNKLNIVAAPGSGKTILGLEIVRRLNKNVLILSPTLTIKNQWIDRFMTLFVQDNPAPGFISTDIYNLNRFNAATYQGLHFAHRRRKIDEQPEAEEEENTKTGIRGKAIEYDLIAELKAKNIEVIVLDEAHHLRSAWWKSLTEVLKALEGIKTIALTATPPYDVDKSEWDRYVEICGPVDCEISVPELVATNDLCPHQDFIVFNKLSHKEEAAALDIQGRFYNFAQELIENQEFIHAISNLPEINHYAQHEERILENPKYYSSLLIFLEWVGQAPKGDIVRALGGGAKIPALDMVWLEIMLQGVLVDDAEPFKNHRAIMEKIRNDLARAGGFERKRVNLQSNIALKKLMAGSIGKMDSIIEIVRREYACLKGDLSMAILVDYIRREALEHDDNTKIGVVPIFKKIIQANLCPSAAILTGSLKVIPQALIPFVKERLPECEFNDIGLAGYVSINIRDAYKNRLVGIITDAVTEKKLNIVIGTVALLGEGWDCPAINSLVVHPSKRPGRHKAPLEGNLRNLWRRRHKNCKQPANPRKKRGAVKNSCPKQFA